MFDNIGGKIKGLAIIFTAIGILGSIVGGIVLICVDEDLIASGVILMIAGTLVSWLASVFLYGFGQLVENSDILSGRMTLEKVGFSKFKIKRLKEDRTNDTEDNKAERNRPDIESRLAALDKLHTSGVIGWQVYQEKYAEIMKEADVSEE